MRVKAILVCQLLALVLYGASCSQRRPNIVIILADDMGYGDVQCYNPKNGRIATPHIDRLAAEGMLFTDAHSSSGICTPSRYTLLTGRYHWRSRLQRGIAGHWERPLIAPERLTIAGLARQHGYRTAAIGKWHLGWNWPIDEGLRAHFTKFGPFEGQGATDTLSFLATDEDRRAWMLAFSKPITGGPTAVGFDTYFGTDVPNWPPFCFIRDDRTVGIPTEFLKPGEVAPNQASFQGPALENWRLDKILETLVDSADAFIRAKADAREPFLLYLPLTSPHTPLAVTERWKGKSGLNNLYADFVMETDAAVGRVLQSLEENGLSENTLVIFTSDNGTGPYIGVEELRQQGHYASGPLRGYKGDVWEGGHRMPFIVRFPGVVKAGSRCGQLVHHADIMATLAELFGAKLPDNAGEDSFSLMPVLTGGTQPVRENAVSCRYDGLQGFRKGPMKIVFTEPPQLYDLDSDVGETKDLAAESPAVVAGLKALREKIIVEGRSNTGPPQENDVDVRL